MPPHDCEAEAGALPTKAEPFTPAPAKDTPSRGWFPAIRFRDMPEMVRANRNAFLLAYIIAYRARWSLDSFNPLGLDLGEAAIDYERWGLSEQEFKTARKKLEAWKFATFRATSRGTIGKLTDTRLFSLCASEGNEPANDQATSSQRAANEQATTNEERKSSKSINKANSLESPFRFCKAGDEDKRPDWNGLNTSEKMVKVLGNAEIGKRPDWIIRAERNPTRIEAIMDAIHSDLATGRVIKNRGAYAEQLWKIAK